MSRRAPPSAPAFTSLLDVLFILVFAALVRTASLQEAAAEQDEPALEPGPAMPPPAAPADERAELARRALAHFDATLRTRRIVIARVARDGTLTAVEDGQRTLTTAIPLLARVADPDVGLVYLGERAPELRLCAVVREQLGTPDLSTALVIIVPAVPVNELTVALVDGLRRDEQRCAADQKGLAVVLDPSQPAPPAGSPAPTTP